MNQKKTTSSLVNLLEPGDRCCEPKNDPQEEEFLGFHDDRSPSLDTTVAAGGLSQPQRKQPAIKSVWRESCAFLGQVILK